MHRASGFLTVIVVANVPSSWNMLALLAFIGTRVTNKTCGTHQVTRPAALEPERSRTSDRQTFQSLFASIPGVDVEAAAVFGSGSGPVQLAHVPTLDRRTLVMPESVHCGRPLAGTGAPSGPNCS
jgi:hypothetical protein